MHELSIAQSLIELIESQFSGAPARIVAVRVRVGVWSGVLGGALRTAFAEASAGTITDSAILRIDETPLVVWCDHCVAERTLEGARLICPACGARTPQVVGGRELELVSVEIQDDADAANAGSADADP